MKRRQPRIIIISKREMKKREGISKGGYTKGRTIYLTRDAGEFVREHEKAHVKLGHKGGAKLNSQQFIRRELRADKMASEKLGRKYRKYYLDDIVDDTAKVFDVSKREARPHVIREAKKLKLI